MSRKSSLRSAESKWARRIDKRHNGDGTSPWALEREAFRAGWRAAKRAARTP